MRIGQELLDLLFPPKCPFCGKLLEKGALLCPECQRELPWLTGEEASAQVELVKDCVCALRYQDRVRQAIHGYKFHGRSAGSGAFGRLIAQAVTDRGISADVVSWPSLSPKRLRQRGYDQARLLAVEVGRALELPVLRTLDKEERPAQSGLEGEAERRANLLGAYTAHDPEGFRGKRVLLVDDVLTTGATLSECAGTLLRSGAEAVFGAALAKAGK